MTVTSGVLCPIFDRRGLVYAATMATPEAWRAVCRALDTAQRVCVSDDRDRPSAVFREAAERLDECSLPYQFCRYAAPSLAWERAQ